MLVDLERRRPLALPADREADTVAWYLQPSWYRGCYKRSLADLSHLQSVGIILLFAGG